MRCLDILLNIISECVRKAFLDEISIQIRRLGRTDCPPNTGGHHSIHWRPARTMHSGGRGNLCTLSCSIAQKAGTMVFSCPQHSWSLKSSDLDWSLYHHSLALIPSNWLPWVSSWFISISVSIHPSHPSIFCLSRVLFHFLENPH